jgi:hypothetical protein
LGDLRKTTNAPPPSNPTATPAMAIGKSIDRLGMSLPVTLSADAVSCGTTPAAACVRPVVVVDGRATWPVFALSERMSSCDCMLMREMPDAA